jgi:hypothetical protein
MKIPVLLLPLFLAPVVVLAQTPPLITPSCSLQFDYSSRDDDISTEYRVAPTFQGQTTATLLTVPKASVQVQGGTVTIPCAATRPISFFAASPPGSHTVVLFRVASVGGVETVSAASNSAPFRAPLSAASNLRILP